MQEVLFVLIWIFYLIFICPKLVKANPDNLKSCHPHNCTSEWQNNTPLLQITITCSYDVTHFMESALLYGCAEIHKGKMNNDNGILVGQSLYPWSSLTQHNVMCTLKWFSCVEIPIGKWFCKRSFNTCSILSSYR